MTVAFQSVLSARYGRSSSSVASLLGRLRRVRIGGALLLRFSQLLDDSRDELARIITLEQGKAQGESRGEVNRAAVEARYMAGEASRPDGEAYPSAPRLYLLYPTFTGSSDIGLRLYESAARRLGSVQLELGGKNPAIVVDYDDLELAAREIVSAAFLCSGQRCTALSRVIVVPAWVRWSAGASTIEFTDT